MIASSLALNAVHDDWVIAHADVPFQPGGHGSDYNQHFPDIEADGAAEDAFAEAANRAMNGPGPELDDCDEPVQVIT